jgi:hypothetical protein
LNAFQRDRPLHGFQNRGLVRWSFVSDRVRKTPFGHPDQPVQIAQCAAIYALTPPEDEH